MSFLQAVRLHATAAGTGGGILVLGFLLPMFLTIRHMEDLVLVVKLAMMIVFITVVISAPFTLIFWLTNNANRTLTKPVAALYGASTAFTCFLLLFVIAGEQPRFSGDFPLTLGLLLAAGAIAGLLFHWRLMASAARFLSKG